MTGPRLPAPCRWVVLTMLCLPAASPADQTYFEPETSLRLFYYDNVGLDLTDEINSAGFVARAAMAAGRRSESADLGIETSVLRREFEEDPERDSTDASLDALASRIFERGRLGIRLELDYDSTQTSELETTGLISERKRRRRQSIAPYWRREFDERSGLTFSVSSQRVEYEDAEATPLVDYDYDTLGLSLNYGNTEIVQLLAQLDYYDYDPDSVESNIRAAGLQLGGRFGLDEIWSLQAQVGVRRAEAAGESERGQLGSLRFNRLLERGQIELSHALFLEPAGTGELLETRRTLISWQLDLTPRLRGHLEIEEIRNEGSDLLRRSGGDRRYRGLLQWLRYRIDRNWALSIAYRYRFQEYDEAADSADGGSIFATLTYRADAER